ncbi:MAG: hypothetical protein L0Y70_16920 [Gemmataceae bacterium]|nr:hypothetical protein [Gemmataceae bacterium]
MRTEKKFLFLETKPGSLYRQPFVRGTRIRAEIPYSATIAKKDEEGDEPGMSPEEVARDLELPLEAVQETIDWCRAHWDVVIADHAREDRLSAATGMNHPNYKSDPNKHYKAIAPKEYARIIYDEELPR